jgi:hypothetical protein
MTTEKHRFLFIGLLLLTLLSVIISALCADVPAPEATFELDKVIIQTNSTQLPGDSSSTSSYINPYDTSSETSSSIESSSSESSSSNSSSTMTSVDPGLMDVRNFHVSFDPQSSVNHITWTIPPTSEYKGAMVRVGVFQWNDEMAAFPVDESDGTLVADVSVDDIPNNRTQFAASVPCPPEPANAYFFAIFAYDDSGIYTSGVFERVVPQDVIPPNAVLDPGVVYNSGGDEIQLGWTNAPETVQTRIKYATVDGYPQQVGDGSGVSGNPFVDPTTTALVATPTKGRTYYFSFFAEDCHGNVAEPSFGDVTIPLDPPTDLLFYPGVNQMFISWTTSADANEYIIRYNTTGTSITTIEGGFPVTTIEFPNTPGIVPGDHNYIEHALDVDGNPLEPLKTYTYAVFAKSSTGVTSNALQGSYYLNDTIDLIYYDDFEGGKIFCQADTWMTEDLWFTGSGDHYIFWGPYNNPQGAFEGNYYAFSGSQRSDTNDCAVARTWRLGNYYEEYQQAMMSHLVSENLTIYSKVYLVWRYNFYTDRSDSGCWRDSGWHWLGEPELWINTTGSHPTRSDTEIDIQMTYLDQAWTGWKTKVVDLTNYRTNGQTAFGFCWETIGDNSCSYYDYTGGGWRIDTVSLIGIP